MKDILMLLKAIGLVVKTLGSLLTLAVAVAGLYFAYVTLYLDHPDMVKKNVCEVFPELEICLADTLDDTKVHHLGETVFPLISNEFGSRVVVLGRGVFSPDNLEEPIFPNRAYSKHLVELDDQLCLTDSEFLDLVAIRSFIGESLEKHKGRFLLQYSDLLLSTLYRHYFDNKWGVSISQYDYKFNSRIGTLVKALIEYHEKIMSNEYWEVPFEVIQKQKIIDGKITALDEWKKYFPSPDNHCYTLPLDSKNISLDIWLYSFWVRRHEEGSLDLVYEVLTEINQLLTSPELTT